MAEAVAAIGLAASVASLIEIGGKVVSRVRDYKARESRGPAVFQDITDQMPLLLKVLEQLQERITRDLSPQNTDDLEKALSRTIEGCARQVKEINVLIEKWLPSADDSRLKRARKVLGSLQSEKKILEALRILETYKSTIIMVFTASRTSMDGWFSLDTFYDIPSRQCSHFVRRTSLLDQMASELEDNTASKRTRNIVVLHGMGGQGKTQLALEYCRRSQEAHIHKVILWIDASSEQTLIRSYGKIVDKLAGSRVVFPNEQSRVTYLKNFLNHRQDSWLLVLDNYDAPNTFQSIKDYLPETNLGCLIITSRHGGAETLGPVVTVSGMTEDEAVQLLLQAAKIETTTENYTLAKVIVQKLAFFALAIDQAASYIFSRQLPLKEFLDHYDRRTRAILEHTPAMWEYRRKQGQADKENSLSAFTTWEMSLEQLADGDDATLITHLLTLSAFLDSSNVNETLFRTYLDGHTQCPQWMVYFLTGAQWDEYRFQDITVLLKSYSLIESTDLRSGRIQFSLHPLIKEWLQLRLDSVRRQEYIHEAIEMVAANIESQSMWEATYESRSLWLSNMDACVANDTKYRGENSTSAFQISDDLANTFASALNFHGRYLDAKSMYESVLSYQKKTNSQGVSRSFINLANTFRNLGDYEKAERLYEQVTQLRLAQFGASHSDTLHALEGLAVMHSLQEKYEEAGKEFRQILKEREKLLGNSHADTLRAIEAFADMQRRQGGYDEAEALFARVLIARIAENEPSHLLTLQCAEGLAIVYRHQGRCDESIRLYEFVLCGLEKTLGDEHPRYLNASLNISIAFVYRRSYSEADFWASRAASGFERLLGSNHRDTIRAAEQLKEVRTLKSSTFKDVLFHKGRQSAFLSTYEERKAKKQLVLEATANETNLNGLEDIELQLPEGATRDTGVIQTNVDCSFESQPIWQLSLPRIKSSASDMNMQSGGWVNLVDQSGKRKLKCAASGEDDDAQYYQERYLSHDSIITGYGPIKTCEQVGASFPALVDILLNKFGIGPDLKEKNGDTRLSKAAYHGYADCVSFFLSRSDVCADTVGHRGWTPLMLACMRGHEQIVSMLLERTDVEVEATDTAGRTPLLIAAWENQMGVVRLLLKTGRVNVDATDHDGWTALLYAVDHSNMDFVKILLDAGAEHVRSVDIYKSTPLDRACYRGRSDIAKVLMASSSPNAEAVNIAFQNATVFGNEDCVTLLLATRLVDAKAKNEYGRTAFWSAASKGRVALCATLLHLGADPSTEDDDGDTPLHKAASYGKGQVVDLIVDSGKANIDATDKKGRTPLSYAVEHGHVDVVEILLQAGARSDFLDPEALTFAKFVKEPERREAVKRLLRDAHMRTQGL
jgi:ankyrin repeat protein/tetratricopeptide (TPR) repeat protein